MNLDRYEIRINDRSGNQKSFISSTAGMPPVLSAQFSLERNMGCREFEMVCARDAVQGTIQIGYLLEVWSKPTGGTLTRYYTGKLREVPKSGTASREVRYVAEGLWSDVAEQLIEKYYAGKDVPDMIIDILAVLDNDSDIDSSTSEISISSPYTVGDLESELENAAKVIEELAQLQGDVQYGVDQDGKLYFKDLSTTDNAHFWVGTHLESFELVELGDEIVNDLFLQSKTVVGGGELTLNKNDSTSITAYGKRSRVINIPKFSANADIQQYGSKVLADDKDPKEITTAKPTGFVNFIFPRGNARITDGDDNEHSLPIQRVNYRLDGTAGFVGDMEIGDRPQVTVEEEIRRMLREIQINKSKTASLSTIEHTRGEEFAQESTVDAGLRGEQNRFFDTMANSKVFDETLSSHMVFRDRYLVGPLDFAKTTAISNSIPTGESIDTIRLHSFVDHAGRINFDRDDDLSFFFEGSGFSSFRVAEDDNRLEQRVTTSNLLVYKDESGDVPSGQTGFTMPDQFTLWASFDFIATGTTNSFSLQFGRQDLNNLNRVSLENNATNLLVKLYKKIGASETLLETATLTKDQNVSIKVQAQNSPSNTAWWVYDRDGENILHTGSLHAIVNANGGFIAFSNLMDGSSNELWRCNWFQIDPSDDPTVFPIKAYMSRDNGTTYTAAQILFGKQHNDFDLSSQPAGAQLRVKFEMQHPGRLYGWGISFKN